MMEKLQKYNEKRAKKQEKKKYLNIWRNKEEKKKK